jgi:phage terminase small subunit
MRGRKPVLAPVNVVALPTSEHRIPPPAATLPEGAQSIWKVTVRELMGRGLWGPDIVAIVEGFCIQRFQFLRATKMIEETGGPLIPTANGGQTFNAWNSIANKAHDRMLRAAAELGLTSVSRQRAGRQKGSSAGTSLASKYLKLGTCEVRDGKSKKHKENTRVEIDGSN